MKVSSKGFTLIELMIVIAIIGVLAAALFPMMTNYMARSRDTARIADVGQISLAVINRYTDKGAYPAPTATNCVNDTLLQIYMQKVPKDPILRPTAPCTLVDGSYAYATGSSASGTGTAFAIASSMEIGGNANSTGAITPNFNATTFSAYTVAIKNGYATGYYIVAR